MGGGSNAESPAEVMRRAAKLMRERAEGCEPRRWFRYDTGKDYPQRIASEGNVALIAETFIDPSHRPYEAEHIASWNPLVAAAVADWMDAAAATAARAEAEGASVHADSHALKVARAYLGEVS
jgi:hypothetical protein